MKKIYLLLITLMLGICLNAQNMAVIEQELQEVLNQKGDGMISVNIILKSQIDNEKLISRLNNIKAKEDKKELDEKYEEMLHKGYLSKANLRIIAEDSKTEAISEARGKYVFDILTNKYGIDADRCTHPGLYWLGFPCPEKGIADKGTSGMCSAVCAEILYSSGAVQFLPDGGYRRRVFKLHGIGAAFYDHRHPGSFSRIVLSALGDRFHPCSAAEDRSLGSFYDNFGSGAGDFRHTFFHPQKRKIS